MTLLAVVAALILAAVIVVLTRPLLKGAVAVDARREQMEGVRDRLMAQLAELDTERADQGMDAAIAADEQRRLEFELAQVLRELEAIPALSASGPVGQPSRRFAAAMLVMIVPMVAAALYGIQGRGSLRVAANPPEQGQGGAQLPPMVMQMVGRLEKRLAEQPNDPKGWAQLGRSYAVLGREDDARTAYDKAYRLAPNDAGIVAEYAWLLYKRDPTNTQGLVRTLYTTLYRLDPRHQDAQWFLGLASYQSGQYQAAVKYWQELAAGLPKGSNAEQGVRKAIAQAEARIKK